MKNTKTMTQKNAGVRTVYTFDQLSEESKEKARDWFREGNYDYFMQLHMIDLLKEELDERGIKYETDSIDVHYSLSYCQGDGFMFDGLLYWNGKSVTIKHNGHYYHSKSKTVEIEGTDGLGHYDDDEYAALYKEFEELYQAVCEKMERAGYAEIEYQNSDEYIDESMEANEYTFTSDGKRLDADKERCHAQVKEDWCEAEAVTNKTYCEKHAEEFGENPNTKK